VRLFVALHDANKIIIPKKNINRLAFMFYFFMSRAFELL